MLYATLLLFAALVSSEDEDIKTPWSGTQLLDLPRICVLARTYPSPRMRLLLPAFLHSLLGNGYPSLKVFLFNTDFLIENIDEYLESASHSARSAYGGLSGNGEVHVVHLSAEDRDVGNPVLGVSGWPHRASGDFEQPKGPRWTRGWVTTDVVLNRLLRCGTWQEPCPWEGQPWMEFGNASSSPPCDYFLVTNTDNSYGAAFLSEVWGKGIAPLWPRGGRAAFWNAPPGAGGRLGRDLIGVHYVTYYKSGGASGMGEESSRFAPRYVSFPLDTSGVGQSLDLGALVWSAKVLREGDGGSFLAKELQDKVFEGLLQAASESTLLQPLSPDGERAIVTQSYLSSSLCRVGLQFFCAPSWATLEGESLIRTHVEAAIKPLWASIYARDHVQAHTLHSQVVLPRRLLLSSLGEDRGGGDQEIDFRLAQALVAAARGQEGVLGGSNDLNPVSSPPKLDPLIVLPGLLFQHQ